MCSLCANLLLTTCASFGMHKAMQQATFKKKKKRSIFNAQGHSTQGPLQVLRAAPNTPHTGGRANGRPQEQMPHIGPPPSSYQRARNQHLTALPSRCPITALHMSARSLIGPRPAQKEKHFSKGPHCHLPPDPRGCSRGAPGAGSRQDQISTLLKQAVVIHTQKNVLV